MNTPDVDPVRCPLCGQANACAMATPGGDESPCWCTQASFSPELLARVPAEQRGLACICSRCAQQDAPPATRPAA